ncbi:hypothetical protein AVEN_116367-1 [Araneus ventricosus]|uniref:Uncharacterized protein n=1 Tax=Araneus ventricosus TaxID=182803 RepID=A0A4Y2K7D7_ARAVE|nr:hypothetical protein AVEN_116367-1 [Araneus ventricosus]
MLGPWIHEVVSTTVHVHPPDTIGNETRQTRQLVSSHQQFNAGVGGPRRGITLCAVQSTAVHEWDIANLFCHRGVNFVITSSQQTCFASELFDYALLLCRKFAAMLPHQVCHDKLISRKIKFAAIVVHAIWECSESEDSTHSFEFPYVDADDNLDSEDLDNEEIE